MGPMSAGPRPPNADPVARERALDPRTGLPVVRYVGPYPPTLRPGAPAPVGAWRVLASEPRDGRWFVELETAASARPLAEVASSVDDGDVEELLEVLEDAARLGVAHGGLTIDRLWRHGPSVRVEGYGVGWAPEADADGDRAAVARALLDLPGTAITAPMRARLEALAGHPTGAEAPPPVAPAPAPADAPPPRPPAAPPVAATFVKGPPPGARVRPGDTPLAPLHERAARAVARAQASAEGRRRLALGATLVLAVVVLASLSVALQRRPEPVAPVAGSAVAYVVDVRVEPAGLPPARLVVLESPPGSRLVAGTVVGSVPRRVPLDRAGTWRFEAHFLDRRSEPATLELPRDRSLVLVFPDPTTAAP